MNITFLMYVKIKEYLNNKKEEGKFYLLFLF